MYWLFIFPKTLCYIFFLLLFLLLCLETPTTTNKIKAFHFLLFMKRESGWLLDAIVNCMDVNLGRGMKMNFGLLNKSETNGKRIHRICNNKKRRYKIKQMSTSMIFIQKKERKALRWDNTRKMGAYKHRKRIKKGYN